MRTLFLLAVACALTATPLHAMLEWQYGWEDGTTTALGVDEDVYGAGLTLENSADVAYEGSRSLKITEDPRGGTPKTYLWWIHDMQGGERVTASIRVYDVTPGGLTGLPSARIWAHYTDNVSVTTFLSCAGGDLNYSTGDGWVRMERTYAFSTLNGTRSGMTIQVRSYSGAADGTNVDGNVIYVDDTHIRVQFNDNVKITRADGLQIPEPALGLAGAMVLAFILTSARKH